MCGSAPDPPPPPPPIAGPPEKGALFVRPNMQSRPNTKTLMDAANQIAMSSLQIPLRQLGQ